MELEIEADQLIGEEGWLELRRLVLRNRRDDGSRSEPYTCDFVQRPRGIDAVVVVVYQRDGGGISVLLRDGLRPALRFGRAPAESAFLSEVVAGILETSDAAGPEGVRARAAAEVFEEAGFRVDAGDILPLGTTLPAAGIIAERLHLCAVEVDPSQQQPLVGDGSPMEEGASTRWLALDDAIAACASGEIEDAKTEIGLRRLRDRLR